MRLNIPLEIWQKMQGYTIAAAPSEITGVGTIEVENDEFWVRQIFVPEQKTSPGHCETVDGALNEIILDMIEDNPEALGDLRFRWHSHAEGMCFWSQVDQADIDAWEAPWVINLVMNVREEYLARLDLFGDLRVKNVPLDVKIITGVPSEILHECQKEVAEKVTLVPWTKNGTKSIYDVIHEKEVQDAKLKAEARERRKQKELAEAHGYKMREELVEAQGYKAQKELAEEHEFVPQMVKVGETCAHEPETWVQELKVQAEKVGETDANE